MHIYIYISNNTNVTYEIFSLYQSDPINHPCSDRTCSLVEPPIPRIDDGPEPGLGLYTYIHCQMYIICLSKNVQTDR